MSALALLLVGIIGVAFRGSWTAHRDAALAAHFDHWGAVLYPFAPDGLIVIALIAAMVLRHDPRARFYSLSIVGGFTFSSYIINHLHGLGTFAADPVSGQLPRLHWLVVGLIAGQLIGAMFFGSHLLVYVLRHLFPGAATDQREHPSSDASETAITEAPSAPAQAVRVEHLPPDPEQVAATVYDIVLDLGHKIGRDRLAAACGIGPRVATRVRKAVELRREEAELDREEAAETTSAAPDSGDLDEAEPYALAAVNGSAPAGPVEVP